MSNTYPPKLRQPRIGVYTGHSSPRRKLTGLQLLQSGLSLIEVLIALLVLSIGLIGIASLHILSLQNTHSSYYSSMASSIALDFEERLWLEVANLGADACVNQGHADNIATNLQTNWSGSGSNGGDSVLVQVPGLTIVAGTVIQPTGAGVNTHAEVPVTIEWPDTRFDDGNSQFTYKARVPCYLPSAE